MIDINSLQLREPDPMDWDNYDTGERKAIYLPPKGQYQLQCMEVPEPAATKEGYLMLKFPVFMIVKRGDPADGHEIRYTNMSVKKWAKREGSPLGDYLKSHGISGQRTNAEYLAAAEATVGRVSEAGVDWRGYCKDCGTDIKGMEAFPIVDGVRQNWMDCPKGCVDNTDLTAPRPKRIWANSTVTFFRALK